MYFLHQNGFLPLINGSSVADAIRQVPYRDIDCLCFANAEQLETLLHAHKAELHCCKIELVQNTFFRFTFNLGLNQSEPEVFDVSFLPGSDRAAALYQSTKNYALGWSIYYCIFNEFIIDPCRQYTRIKQGILDFSRILDDSFNSNQFFKQYPDRMLQCLAKDAKYRHYNKPLQSSAIKEDIIANKQYLHGETLSKKFPQSLFDKLFLRGYDILTIAYDQCDIMHLLFPMMQKIKADVFAIYNACLTVNQQHQRMVSVLIDNNAFNPAERVPVLSGSQENELRILFLDTLLKQKFFDLHETSHYTGAGGYRYDLFKTDVTHFVGRCSFNFYGKILQKLTEDWWPMMVERIQNEQQHVSCFSYIK